MNLMFYSTCSLKQDKNALLRVHIAKAPSPSVTTYILSPRAWDYISVLSKLELSAVNSSEVVYVRLRLLNIVFICPEQIQLYTIV